MSRGSATREVMAEVALRMFAERGIDAVSLREITTASGQRNKSAAQYHFGTKEQLVREIFERHTGQVNAHRHRLLATLRERTGRPTLEELADVLIRPLAETVDGHSHYARFLAQVSTPPWTGALVRADPAATQSVQTVFTALAQLLDDLPEPVLRTRLALAMMLTVRALSACEHTMAPGGGPDGAQPDDVRADDTRPDDVRADDTRPDDVRADDTRPDDVRAGGTQGDDVRADEAGADGAQTADARRVALLAAQLVDITVGILRAPVSETTRNLLPPAPHTPASAAGDTWPWHLLIGAEAGL
ncbi:TetR family transcriptional regulator [Streptomyces sp. NPDC059398]|uniref:TetR/AcrR family transcriptional regulator n=1 Tax=Streptomyces sp. NPDC059398 TaxID=3346820 RepID=UPI0036B152E8